MMSGAIEKPEKKESARARRRRLRAMPIKSLTHEEKRDAYSQWYTPRWLAEKVIAWSGIAQLVDVSDERITVIEPSCGTGALIDQLPDDVRLTAYDIDADNVDLVATTASRGLADDAIIECADFLLVDLEGARFDFAIVNPPYEEYLDTAFVLRCTEIADRTIAIVRLAFLAGMKRNREVWAHVDVRRMAIVSSRPDFGGELGAKSDYVVLDLARRSERAESPRSITTIEWWVEE